ncbi:small conductance mechanosensitive channel [Acholeplasma morum]|uniref:mechanosensitive ion channel family protein n=1 Tax=Paracholeplasma morum TaxID=264637 RepID=UPI0019582FCB|nr:mechanosensitive ion channel family protein [Paracholeplasma morum]MBM7452727.1 small conductance mechanosensitive channel [Paracholeplasma morum]
MSNILSLFTNNIWNAALTIAVIVFVVSLFILENKLMKRYENKWHKVVLLLMFIVSAIVLLAGIGFILFIWGYDFSHYFEDTSVIILEFIEKSLGMIIGSVIVIALSMFIIKIAKLGFKSVGKKQGPLQKRKRTIAKVSLSIVRYFVGILAILIILSIWGVNVLPALAGLGILGLVIGLGAQKFINDLIAGFFIIFEHHFDVGDKIEVGGFKGEVTDIGLKTTRIKNWKGEIKILANGQINELINFSKNPSVAEVYFTIAYEEDAQKVIDLLTKELKTFMSRFPQIIEDPQVLGVTNLNTSGIDLRVIAKTENETHYPVERAMRLFIKEVLDQNNIEIPFQQVVVRNKD